MKTMKHLLLFFIALIGCANLYAQTTVRGRIIDSQRNPIADITIRSDRNVVKSNQHGHFELFVAETGKFSLKVSGIGYRTETFYFEQNGSKTDVGNLTLKENGTDIEGVDVIGYNTMNNQAAGVAKGGILAKDLPQAVQIFNSQIIADQQINTLSDVLKNANGVAMGSNRGAVSENFYARGYSLGGNNIFRDGARTNNGGSIEASTLESAELLKGSAALLYGGVSGGAVLNLVTKKPKFESGGEVSFRAGSYDYYKPTIDVYGPISEKVAFRVISTYVNSESYRDVVKSERVYFNPSVLYNISSSTELNVNMDYLKSDFTPDFGIGSVDGKLNTDVGRSTFLNVPWAYNNTNTINSQANLKHKFNENWNINALVNFQNYNRDYYSSERIQAKANGMAARTLNRTKSDEQTYNQQINVSGIANTGSIKHQVLIGMDADQSNVKNYTFNILDADGKVKTAYDSIYVFNPSAFPLRSDMPAVTNNTWTETNVYRYGIFAQDLVSLTEKFKVLVGIRYTYQRTPESTGYNYAKDSTYTIINQSADKSIQFGAKVDKAFSPKFGLIYQPIKMTSIYASYSNNFTSNTGYDREYRPMDPSIIDQFEAGVKNDFLNGKLSANLTWYKIINNNFAQTIILEDGTSPDANMKEFTGKTASDGIELDVSGQVTPGLNILAGYAYNYMRYLETDDKGAVEDVRLVGTTAHTANGTIFYTFQNGAVRGLKLGASAFYTGKRNAGWNNTKINVAENVNRLIPVDPFTTFDFSAGYTYNRISLLAKVSNIGNVFSYYVHENYSVNPIPPRSFMTTLSYTF